MLDIKYIKENTEFVKENLKKRNFDVSLIDKVLNLYEEKNNILKEFEFLKHTKTETEKEFLNNKDNSLKEKLYSFKDKEKDLDNLLKQANTNYLNVLNIIPNLVSQETNPTKEEEVLKQIDPVKFDFTPLTHDVLGKNLDLIDTDSAGNTSGTRFGFIKNDLVLLEFALIQFVYDKIIQKNLNFTPILPPFFIKKGHLEKTGYVNNPEELEDVYNVSDNLYLIATSEHIIEALLSNTILKNTELPKRFLSFSTCFRKEAGSYGKDIKGILRLHQFDKIEMICATSKDNAKKEHELMISIEEEIVKDLELEYRLIRHGAQDLADPQYESYDIETFMYGQNEYRETHSCSNCTDYQSRRLNIKDENKEYVYLLNGTAIALGRIMIAIMEKHQTKDGNINIPKVLQKYINKTIIKN
jgi:seryl-tRNA synthetase